MTRDEHEIVKEDLEFLVKMARPNVNTETWLRLIQSITTALDATEKRVPMRSSERFNKDGFRIDCPDCETFLTGEHEYCPNCGRAIEWEIEWGDEDDL